MNVKGNDITIDIGASSDRAESAINKLMASLRGLKSVSKTKASIKVDTKDVDKAANRVGALSKVLKSLGRVAFYRIIRSAIKAVGDAFREGSENAYWFSKTVGDETRYVADAFDRLASADFKMTNQLGAAWATLKATITPILLEIVELVTKAADVLTQFFAILGGKTTYMKAVDYTKQAYENTAKGAKAAKEWKNQLMGFDEINRLNEPSQGGSGSGSALPDYENMFTEAPVQGWAVKVQNTLSEIKRFIKEDLTNIEKFAIGVPVGLGLLLLLSGINIPLGLALIASGLVIGANIAAIKWDAMPDNIKRTIAKIDLIVGGALLALGIMLTLAAPGFSAIGLGLMAAGAAGLAAGVAINWDYMKNNIGRVVETIAYILSGALLAVGALLAFTTANIPLGIGLMAAGAVGLIAASAINWGGLPALLRGPLGLIMTIAGGFILAIGLVLALSGIALPLGLALMAAGGVSLGVGIKNYDWDGLKKKLQEAFQRIKDWWKSDVAKYFTFSYWQEKINGISPDWGAIFGGLIAWCRAAHDWIQDVLNGLNLLGGANKSNWQNNLTQEDFLTGFASGGFPNNGQLFLARESGPELVGTMGGRTAVANNDQIVEGIRQGVFEAVSAAMSQNTGAGDSVTKVYLDGKEIKSSQTRLARVTGV